MLQRKVHAGDHQVEVFFQGRGTVRRGDAFPEDGEDGAFDRLGNSMVGRFHAGAHSRRESIRIGLFQAFKAFGHAGEDPGKDDAGIAPGPEKHAPRDGTGHLGQLVSCGMGAGFHGHEHIVARIAVGDGEDVQVIDGLPVLGEACGSATDEVQV